MNCVHVSRRFVRNSNWKNWPNNWLPFTWKRPDLQPGYFDTGDRVEGLTRPDPQLPQSRVVGEALRELRTEAAGARGQPEPGELSDEVRRQFTVEFSARKPVADRHIAQQVTELSDRLDANTLAGSIVRMTYRIRNSRQVLRDTPNDVRSKVNICWWSDKRLKRLIELHRYDRAEFDRLVEALQLDRPKFVLDGKMFERVQRKRELRQMTDEYCERLRKEKLDAYQKELAEQQPQFEKEREDAQLWIQQQMQTLRPRD